MRKMARNKYLLSFGLLLMAASFGLFMHAPSASALSASDWQPGRIIDDSVFFNPNTMSTQDIQAFLNSKVPTCDTNGTQIYSGSETRAQYSAAHGVSTPFICLKDYSQTVPAMAADAYCGAIPPGSASAATIIKEVSAACSVNPQVILVLLQKETGLVTDDWPWPFEYSQATGYGCPDSSSCDPSFAGFFNQVYYGARQYQKYAKQPQLFNYSAGQTSYVAYSPDSSCGGTNVAIQNQATAGLYNYTPYQPNQNALANLNGSSTDPCSSYGNRNFWVYYWNWFGNPIGADYAWLIQSFTYSGGDNILTKGIPETVTLKALNVSRHPWYNNVSGNNPVRLGTWQPANGPSPFANLNGTNNRFADMQESEVDPNQVATFVFTITPTTAGTFVIPMNLVAENATWMTWPGFSPTIVVTDSPYQWRVDSVSYNNGTGLMNPGSEQQITVWATNTGNITWTKNSPPVWLATWPPDRNSPVADPSGGKWPSSTRIAQFNEASVAPGGQGSFQFNVRMPGSGDFYERLNLVAEGQNWFNDAGLTLYLHGRTYAWQPVWQSLSTGNPNIGRNQTFDVTVKVKNTGEMAWKKSDPFQVRLATTNPENRGSALYTPGWIGDTRPAALIESDVEPGQEGTFTFNARTPNAAGARYEYFSLVAEGIQWFNDPGFNIYINVL
jgi:hypothetical protein